VERLPARWLIDSLPIAGVELAGGRDLRRRWFASPRGSATRSHLAIALAVIRGALRCWPWSITARQEARP